MQGAVRKSSKLHVFEYLSEAIGMRLAGCLFLTG